ncbi:MAG: metal ABC transporter permease [Planctomycetota bacterium]|nr:metal ABC transporter permease [Planctomycetota bacterium]
MDYLLTPFHYEYMQKAIAVSAVIGAVCGMLSCFVTLKGWSLMGDALSHAIVPGVALAYLLGLPFALGAFVSGLAAALLMGWVKARTPIREDAVIGMVFTTFFAAGVLLISIFPSNISLKTIVFGNILGIADSDIQQMLIIAAVTMLVIGLKWKDLLLFAFDPHQARAVGLNPTLLNVMLLTLLAATSVAALQTVGACLVVAMLVTPGATAYLLTDRFGKMMALAIAMGTLTAAVGAYLSYFLNGSTGGCIVVLQTACFMLALFFAPKHGIVASRVKGRAKVQQLQALQPRAERTSEPA